ncbi:MAG TPA: hypothetical protein VFL16_12165 [Steroidobacteraceae bacterium]|jgi:hypothetical protein|nr:hypothetical protein [Steroidobacteraceae bacterium]
MRKTILTAAACIAVVGAALAQVEATSSTYVLDVDPARYNGPPGQRLAVLLGDQPRHVALNAQDEICVQLQRATTDSSVVARVKVLKPEKHDAAVVVVAGPGVSPGTFRSTPWGMLLRMVPEKAISLGVVKPVGTADAPVCTL